MTSESDDGRLIDLRQSGGGSKSSKSQSSSHSLYTVTVHIMSLEEQEQLHSVYVPTVHTPG